MVDDSGTPSAGVVPPGALTSGLQKMSRKTPNKRMDGAM